MARYVEFNMNQTVKVRLNQIGLNELEKQHNELFNSLGKPRKWTPPEVDSAGYAKFQMWSLVSSLGHLISLGDKLPFDLDILLDVES